MYLSSRKSVNYQSGIKRVSRIEIYDHTWHMRHRQPRNYCFPSDTGISMRNQRFHTSSRWNAIRRDRYTTDSGMVRTAREVKSNRRTKLRRRPQELSPRRNLTDYVLWETKLLPRSTLLLPLPWHFFSSPVGTTKFNLEVHLHSQTVIFVVVLVFLSVRLMSFWHTLSLNQR